MKLNKNGYIQAAVVAGVLAVLLIALAALSVWLFASYNTANTTLDQQVETAVAAAKTEQKEQDEAAFAEVSKLPYRTYKVPEIYGAISISFPKNWSVFVEEGQGSGSTLDAYVHPLAVVKKAENPPAYALRMKIDSNLYTEQTQTYSSALEDGSLKAKAITLSGISGTRYDGKLENISPGAKGSLVLLPIRDKTLSIWTEDESYLKDFNNILARVKLAP